MTGLSLQDLGYEGAPFLWDDERRFLLRCELDAAFFHMYGMEREEVNYIMDTFPGVEREDNVAAHGEYRTKRVILEVYDDTGGLHAKRRALRDETFSATRRCRRRTRVRYAIGELRTEVNEWMYSGCAIP